MWTQTPAFLGSFAIASIFFKFGSFALECVAFLATWYFIDLAIFKVREIFIHADEEDESAPPLT